VSVATGSEEEGEMKIKTRTGSSYAPKLLAVMGVLVLASAAAGGAAGAQRESRSSHRTLILLQGKRNGSGCQYQGKVTLHPGEAAIVLQEVKSNPEACAVTLREKILTRAQERAGSPTGRTIPSGGRESVIGKSRAVQPLTLCEGPTNSQMANTTPRVRPGIVSPMCTLNPVNSAGYAKGTFEDKAGIDLNSVKDTVNWTWDGSIVYGGATCSYSYNWISADGWGLHENNFYCQYNSSNPPTQVDSSSYVHYRNGIFCTGFDTDVYYNRVHAYGRANGDLVGSYNWSDSGPCSGLLSFHFAVVRTLN
jgi:hypothetical protein